MKLKTLLAAASALALMSTTAHAIELNLSAFSTDGITFAQEIPAEDITPGNLVFNVDITAGLTTGVQNGATLTVVLPGGYEFASAASGADILGGVNSPGVVSGGAPGDTSVQYSFNTASGQSSIPLSIPVQFTGCDDIGSDLAVALRTANGAFIDGPPASLEGVLDDCVSFASATVTADTDLTVLTSASSFSQLSTAPGTDADLGVIATSLTAGAAKGVDSLGAEVLIGFGDIASVDYDVVITNSDEVTAVSDTVQDGTTDTWNDNGSLGAGGSVTVSLTIDPANSDDLAAKTASVENGLISLVSTLNPTAGVEFSGDLQGVSREAEMTGEFDWVSSTGTDSIFRITELPAGETNMNVIIIDGHLDGVPVSGTTAGTITANDAGEAILTSLTKFGVPALPDFTRAKIALEFEVPSGMAPDVDRLLVSPAGQVYNFGDLNNQ